MTVFLRRSPENGCSNHSRSIDVEELHPVEADQNGELCNGQSGAWALGPASLSSAISGNAADLEQEQQGRVALRERYLRSLLAMAGRPISFAMYERVNVTALFGASDIDILNFQVSQLQTPLGVQREALLRCSDIIAYSFEL